MFWSFSKQSIFARLSLLYTSLAFLLILVTSLMLYFLLVNNIQDRDEGFVTGEVHTLENILKGSLSDNVLLALRQEVMLEPKTSLDHYLVRIKKEDNKILIETPGFDQLNFSSQAAKAYIISHKTTLVRGEKYNIEVVLDVSSSKEQISRYQRNLFISLFLNIFVSSFLGYIITSAGIRPIKRMNRSLKHIHADELDMRLSIDDLPKELRDMGRAINDLLSRVEEAFQRLSQFSSDLAHELRTPLNSMICQSEIILTKPRVTEEYQAALASNLGECHKLSDLIDKILFIARAKDPQKLLELSFVQFSRIAATIVEYFDVLANEKSINITVMGEALLHVDVDLFKRAIANLLANALKYTPEGGQIALEATLKEDCAVIRIIDSGMGIEANHLPHLFDRFYRVSDSRSRNDGGSGLGLAIVKSIMLLHSGSVTVESQPDVGTTFTLFFPNIGDIARL